MSLYKNTRDISLISFAAEPFMIFIPIVQCKYSGIIGFIFYIDILEIFIWQDIG